MGNEFIYIYNQRQADFFYQSGLKIIEIGKGKKGDTFIKFSRSEKAESLFQEWLNKKDNILLKHK